MKRFSWPRPMVGTLAALAMTLLVPTGLTPIASAQVFYGPGLSLDAQGYGSDVLPVAGYGRAGGTVTAYNPVVSSADTIPTLSGGWNSSPAGWGGYDTVTPYGAGTVGGSYAGGGGYVAVPVYAARPVATPVATVPVARGAGFVPVSPSAVPAAVSSYNIPTTGYNLPVTGAPYSGMGYGGPTYGKFSPVTGPVYDTPAVTAFSPVVAPAASGVAAVGAPVQPGGRPVSLGTGIIGQPTVYVEGQPVRNFLRSISP